MHGKYHPSKLKRLFQDEIHHFLDVLDTSKGHSIDLAEPLAPSISNNICSLVFGKRYEYSDQDRVYLDSNFKIVTDEFSHTNPAMFFPWLLKMPIVGKMLSLEKGYSALQNVRNLLK